MCGRFVLEASAQAIADYLHVEPPAEFAARYNIAPTTLLLAKTEQGLSFFRWGLVPAWAKQASAGYSMFNARVETVMQKPSFRQAFKCRRCLIPANGFYEWQAQADGKQPYFCHLQRSLFCFAGIWESWQDPNGNELHSCAILTTQAVGELSLIHTRMPVVIRDEHHPRWLDHGQFSTDNAEHCIARANAGFELYAVSRSVNSVSHDGSDLLLAI